MTDYMLWGWGVCAVVVIGYLWFVDPVSETELWRKK